MEKYFELQTFFKFIIPGIIIGGLVAIFIIAAAITSFTEWRKSRIMRRYGYKYDRGLGTKVAYEFQPHWEKEWMRINCRKISGMKVKQVKAYVLELESKFGAETKEG